MAVNEYDIGDKVRTTATFTDPNSSNAKVDPTTIELHVRDPSGNVAVYTYGTDANVTKSATGEYVGTFDVDESGDWYYRWEGEGAVVAADEKKIRVLYSTVLGQ